MSQRRFRWQVTPLLIGLWIMMVTWIAVGGADLTQWVCWIGITVVDALYMIYLWRL